MQLGTAPGLWGAPVPQQGSREGVRKCHKSERYSITSLKSWELLWKAFLADSHPAAIQPP